MIKGTPGSQLVITLAVNLFIPPTPRLGVSMPIQNCLAFLPSPVERSPSNPNLLPWKPTHETPPPAPPAPSPLKNLSTFPVTKNAVFPGFPCLR